MVVLLSLIRFISFAFAVKTEAKISIYPITEVNETNRSGYFSDPYHVPYDGSQGIYISGTTQKYLECDNTLGPKCASLHNNTYESGKELLSQKPSGTYICSAAGIHPFQSGSGASRAWDAAVTLHLQDNPNCDGITGWSVIVHAHPADPSSVGVPPTSWVGDQLLIGSFSHSEDANYDGKYFRTPAGQLYLLYSKQQSPKPKKRDGVAAWPMDDPKTKTPGTHATFLLVPDDDLNSEDYTTGNHNFKLVETGNVRAINGKFVMAYSVGAYFNKTYKAGVAFSDTFLPPQSPEPQYYRKIMKANPEHLWGSSKPKEVYYLVQADQNHAGWRYVGDQVLAPGVPTVARIGQNHGWVLTFAGFDPDDAPMKPDSTKYVGNHRRPYFINIDVNVPENVLVKQASDAELRSWIVPI
ncbi:Fc.00g055330.m01.CDS01 [Cosmosporella sp. VM-42]